MTTKRHPAEVTSDRLANALDLWPDEFDGGDRDRIAQIRFILDGIAERRTAKAQPSAPIECSFCGRPISRSGKVWLHHKPAAEATPPHVAQP